MSGTTPPDSGLARPDDCKTDKWIGDYVHICDRTGAVLDEFDDDFRHCRCFQPTKQILALQDAINVRLNASR
jgi:hypothetical protein